ncbi:transglutaminase-like domain-containing protein [Candidatus Bathyarchaeota archaeon]|nr:transglutaminase-like domain-containing protein [Candidatus Bathyarchaeota archaeon]
MNPVRKVRATRRHRQSRRWIIFVSVLLIVATLLTVAYFWYPKNEPGNNTTNEPAAFKDFTDHYMGIMQNLNSTQTKAKIASQLDPKYNQTDLFSWEQTKLTFTQDTTGWFEDPNQILNSGKGICVQWSIVYVSACLANGYQSRLVVATDIANWNFIHVWAEDYFNGSWVHVDPSDKVWDNPSRYQSWDWGKGIGVDVKIYAFEDGRFEEVTSNYDAHSS